MEIDRIPDVGGLLRAMESDDVDVREAALGRLACAAWRDDELAVATARGAGAGPARP